MTSIESSGFPLVFKVGREAPSEPTGPRRTLRTEVRALEGMQKEALVTPSFGGGTAWRLVSDEGPYLNGKDMAPFPLAFFTAGMQFCFLEALLDAAARLGVELGDLVLETENFYSMEGSFLRGDARGGAMPAALELRTEGGASPEGLAEAVRRAARRSPAEALVRTPLANRFSLQHNGREIPLPGLPAGRPWPDPQPRFATLRPAEGASFSPDIIVRVRQAETVYGVEGGAGSSLKAEQKRTLHVRGTARLSGGTRLETTVDLIKPIGSSFRFLCDTRGADEGTAPPPLVYLVAGIGFCYMTQLGRYAHILRQSLEGYRIVQSTPFERDETEARALPVDTRVFVEADCDEDRARALVETGERTCFLHAAMRAEVPSRFAARLNGAPVPLD